MTKMDTQVNECGAPAPQPLCKELPVRQFASRRAAEKCGAVIAHAGRFVMKCDPRFLFEKKLRAASANFDTAMQSLTERIGVCPKSEFVALSDQLDRAWEKLARTRSAL